jgi:hypothetical protein
MPKEKWPFVGSMGVVGVISDCCVHRLRVWLLSKEVQYGHLDGAVTPQASYERCLQP